MGYEVIAFGQLDVEDDYIKQVGEKLVEFAEKEGDFLRMQDDLDFEMSGNKGVDYTILDQLRDWCKQKNISIEISTSEYSECGSGYYYNTEDEKAEEEKDEKRMSD